MAATNETVPIILCGKSTEIGESVASGLRPRYEVIHFVTSAEEGMKHIPKLLAGQSVSTAEQNAVGSHDYSRVAQAVLFGRAYEKSEVEEVIARCDALPSIPWIYASSSIDSNTVLPPGYATVIANHLVGILDRSLAERKEGSWLVEY